MRLTAGLGERLALRPASTLSPCFARSHIAAMAMTPDKPKDPAKPTRAKASRPDAPPTPDALADLLNPAINKGTAGLGPSTGKNPESGAAAGQFLGPAPRFFRRAHARANRRAKVSAKRRSGIMRPARSRGSIHGWRQNWVSHRMMTLLHLPPEGEVARRRRAGGGEPHGTAQDDTRPRRPSPARGEGARRGRAEAFQIPPAARRPAQAGQRARLDGRRRHRAVARQAAARGPRRIPQRGDTGSLDAAPPAAAGEIRRRPAPRHQVRVRAEGRPAAGDQGSGRGRASATTARRCCSASPARARPSPWRR